MTVTALTETPEPGYVGSDRGSAISPRRRALGRVDRSQVRVRDLTWKVQSIAARLG
jgi:hypothetical protein